MSYSFHKYFCLTKRIQDKLNTQLLEISEYITTGLLSKVNIQMILKNISLLYEHNKIFDYKTLELYKHQKDIFNIFRKERNIPKFVFYCAPTSSRKNIITNSLITRLQGHFHLRFKTYWIKFGKKFISYEAKRLGLRLVVIAREYSSEL